MFVFWRIIQPSSSSRHLVYRSKTALGFKKKFILYYVQTVDKRRERVKGICSSMLTIPLKTFGLSINLSDIISFV